MEMDTYINKGGRGKANPWKSITVRIPEPCLGAVEALKADFLKNHDQPLFLLGNSGPKFPSKSEAIDQAIKILSQKKSARESMSKLLSFLYGEPVKLNP